MNQPQQQNQQRQQPQERREQAFDGITYYLIPSEEPDITMAEEYLAKKGIELGGAIRAVQELQLERLTDKHRVIALYRQSHKDKSKKQLGPEPGSPIEWTPIHAPIEEAKPLNVNEFWTKNAANEFVEGQLSIATFLAALSARIHPAIVKYQPKSEPGVVRVKYA